MKTKNLFLPIVFVLAGAFESVSAQLNLPSLSILREKDYFTHFGLKEVSRRPAGPFTKVSYITAGAFKKYTELHLYIDSRDFVHFASHIAQRSFINAQVHYDKERKEFLVYPDATTINSFAGDEIKSFIGAFAPFHEEYEYQVNALIEGIYKKTEPGIEIISLTNQRRLELAPETEECIDVYSGAADYSELILPGGSIEFKNTTLGGKKVLITSIAFDNNCLDWRFGLVNQANESKQIVYRKPGLTFYLNLNSKTIIPSHSQILDVYVDDNIRLRIEIKKGGKNLERTEQILCFQNAKQIAFHPTGITNISVSSSLVLLADSTLKYQYSAYKQVDSDLLIISSYSDSQADKTLLGYIDAVLQSYKEENNSYTLQEIKGDTIEIEGGDVRKGIEMFYAMTGVSPVLFLNEELARGRDAIEFEKALASSDEMLITEQVFLLLGYNYRVITVTDGKVSHAVVTVGLDRSDYSILYKESNWDQGSFLEEGNNIAGVKAKSHGEKIFSISEGEFKKVIYDILYDPNHYNLLVNFMGDLKNDFHNTVEKVKSGKYIEGDSTFNNEIKMNELGYLYHHHRIDRSIAILKFNNAVHPASANTFDSLAEIYLASGDKENAKINYMKALEILPYDKTIDADLRQRLQTNAETNLKELNGQ